MTTMRDKLREERRGLPCLTVGKLRGLLEGVADDVQIMLEGCDCIDDAVGAYVPGEQDSGQAAMVIANRAYYDPYPNLRTE